MATKEHPQQTIDLTTGTLPTIQPTNRDRFAAPEYVNARLPRDSL